MPEERGIAERGIASLGSQQEMVPVDPSLRDRMHMYLSDTFGHSPEGRRRANMFMDAAEWMPVVDESLLFSDAKEEAEQGNYITSGVLGGAGLLSILPFVPPGIGKNAKKVGRSLEEGLASLQKKMGVRTERIARGEYEFIPPPPDEVKSYPTGRWGGRKENFRPDAAVLKESAARQGYETDRVLYHGARESWVNEDPMFRFTRGGDSGPYLTDKPRIADNYSADPGGNTIPVYVKGPGLKLVDAGKRGEPFGPEFRQEAAQQLNISLENMSRSDQVDAIMDAAREQGYGYVEMKGVIDVGGQQAQIIPLGGDKVRSIWAQFDPGLADDATSLSHASGGLITLPKRFQDGNLVSSTGGLENLANTFGQNSYTNDLDNWDNTKYNAFRASGSTGMNLFQNTFNAARSLDEADALQNAANTLQKERMAQLGFPTNIDYSQVLGYKDKLRRIRDRHALGETLYHYNELGDRWPFDEKEVQNHNERELNKLDQQYGMDRRAFDLFSTGETETYADAVASLLIDTGVENVKHYYGDLSTIKDPVYSWQYKRVKPNTLNDDDLLELYGLARQKIHEWKATQHATGVDGATPWFEEMVERKDYLELVKDIIESRDLEVPTGTFADNVSKIGRTVGKWFDKIFEFLHIPAPDYAVGQMEGGTLIWGEPIGEALFSRIGTTPEGTIVGIQTGIPTLDRILSKVADVMTGRVELGEVFNADTVGQLILDAVSDQLGLEPGFMTIEGLDEAIKEIKSTLEGTNEDGTPISMAQAVDNTIFDEDKTVNYDGTPSDPPPAPKVLSTPGGTKLGVGTTILGAAVLAGAANSGGQEGDDDFAGKTAGADTVVGGTGADTVVGGTGTVDLPPSAMTLGGRLEDIVLGADVSQKEKVGGGQQRIDAGGNVNPDVQTGDEISAVNVGGDVLGSDVGGDVFGSDVGGDVLGSDVGGDVFGSDVGGDVFGSDVGGDISGDRIGGALSFAGAGGEYSNVGAGGATSSDRVGTNVLGMGVGGGDYALGFGGAQTDQGYGGYRTDLVVGDRLYDLTAGGADRAVDLDDVTLGGYVDDEIFAVDVGGDKATSSDKTLEVGGDKLGWETPSPTTGGGSSGMEAEPGDIMELNSIIDTPYSPYSYSEIVAYLKANARKAGQEAST